MESDIPDVWINLTKGNVLCAALQPWNWVLIFKKQEKNARPFAGRDLYICSLINSWYKGGPSKGR